MKLQAYKVANYVRSLKRDNAPALILVYGPDAGGIYETANHIIAQVLGDKADDLQLAKLNEGDLTTPALLSDEAASIPMFGDWKLVRVAGGGSKVAESVDLYLAQPAANAIVLVEAGNLRPNSALRKAVENSPNAMALPCYELSLRDVQQAAQAYLQSQNYHIEAAALDLLADRLTTDRGVMQRELERLVLFKGIPKKPDKNQRLMLTLDDIEAAIGDVAQSNVFALADNIALGNTQEADRILAHLMAAGVSARAAITGVRAHFLRLHQVLGRMENGAPVSRALTAFRPPLNFKRKPLVEEQVQFWSRRKITRALDILNQAEFECRAKSGGNAAFGEVLAQYAFLRLARGASR